MGALELRILPGAGSGVDGNEFVAGGEDSDAGTDVDVEVRISAGSGEGIWAGSSRVPAGELFVTAAGLRAFGYYVVAGVDGTAGTEADTASPATKTCRWGSRCVSGSFNVLEHDDAIGAGGDGSTGHDFPCFALGSGPAGALPACVEPATGSAVRGGFRCAAGVAIAGGAREKGLIIVGGDRGGEDATGGGRESDALGAGVA